jgi:hypothetical protein
MSRVDELFGDDTMGYTAPVAKGAPLGYPEQQHGGFTDLLGFREEMGHSSLEEQRYLQMGGARKSRKTRRGGRKTHRGGRKTHRGGRKTRRGGHKMCKSRKSQRGGRRTTKQGRKPFLNLRVTGRIQMKQRHRQ